MAQRAVYVKQEDEKCLSEKAKNRDMTIEKLIQLIVHEFCVKGELK